MAMGNTMDVTAPRPSAMLKLWLAWGLAELRLRIKLRSLGFRSICE